MMAMIISAKTVMSVKGSAVTRRHVSFALGWKRMEGFVYLDSLMRAWSSGPVPFGKNECRQTKIPTPLDDDAAEQS
jgi:hypothetical protein